MARCWIRFSVAALLVLSAGTARAQTADRLYILNCGEGVAGDISRWSPGVDVGKSKDFVDNCYLIRHGQDWLLWDTGVADAVAAMPNGLVPSDPRAVLWRRPKTLASQLEALGVRPGDIKFVAISHTHPDHIGNVELFPDAMLIVQKAEYDWPNADGTPRFKPGHPVTKVEGDYDIFGDGSVTVLSTPGHTPGHESLLVKLPKTGPVILSGDAAHFQANFDNRRVPSANFDHDETVASMQKLANLMAKDHAQLWINHDAVQRETLKMAPAYYD